ncbi:uncharacterized protein BJX67DRAFT_49603 [Aspergillus lucknowensis]|uniref:Amine oxidase n=1 Tax=Aspergillus lucknowensis TaxID=176173 RepID=A0ABR4LUS6_9EURO
MEHSRHHLGGDPARESVSLKTDMCRNIDLPYGAFGVNHLYSVPVETVPRPGFNQTGKEIEVQMNAFAIAKFPTKTVYQYDVSTPVPDAVRSPPGLVLC